MVEQNKDWLAAIEAELKDNILQFWLEHTVDEENGGFYGFISRDLTVNPQADKGLVLNTRILWTFSTAFRLYGESRYLEMADRAYRYITRYFTDPQHGGLYWMLDCKGAVKSSKKQVYGQAFAIYAFSEYYRATRDEDALTKAAELFHVLERHSYDPAGKGYIEALARDWSETNENSLSDKDLNTKKSMNTHLHVLEAYTNLYRVWPEPALRDKLRELIVVMLRHIVDNDSYHFKLFFDMEWNSQNSHISYGHDIEGSWLIHEAAEVLGDLELLQESIDIAIAMAEVTLREGVDEDGGLFNEAEPGKLLDSDKDWWPQAEAVVGFYNAYQLSGASPYLEAARKSWHFIESNLVDKEYGEWIWSVKRDGSPSGNIEKVSPWKCPYHNSRACFEMIERLRGGSAH
ncbi:AGE family epimerase/isomerase [Paenibacillus sp. CAU 1782]